MGSPSLIIILMIVVWVIVLAPLVFGNNKPIRRSGEGYDETRVLHTGGTEPMEVRRRPRVTAADVHLHDEDAADVELVEAVEHEPAASEVLIDDSAVIRNFFSKNQEDAVSEEDTDSNVIEGEVIEAESAEAETESADEVDEASDDSSDDADAVTLETAEDPEASVAEAESIPDSYYSAADFGYDTGVTAEMDAEELTAEETEDDQDAPDEEVAVTDEDLAFAEARRGRGGWDPDRARRAREDRFMRRQRTFLGLIIACVVTFVIAFVAGGWTWILPAASVALTTWFMVVLRSVVRQERALHRRRMRQLRRARLGVATADSTHPRQEWPRRYGESVALDLDDAHPDFTDLPEASSAIFEDHTDSPHYPYGEDDNRAPRAS
ncbi:gephyrin-like molybdotransferase receptor GlpR [Corynebacterium sp. UMB10119B.1]|uniref:divisome protein SepX/GlpR n=1 Tax=Corynebacterium sp. UMB10119B.1 TaxID=3050601 RepID=UPI0025502C8C|nr:gephyrin-like molybdotransferase receptor GlpR [Corynebacterium sp. UMB10119B]MDK8363362.1 hypothetical protein [Corynebacterium sp. UMB10119B]